MKEFCETAGSGDKLICLRARFGNSGLCGVGLVICLITVSACTSRHMRLVNPDTTPGSRYICGPAGECSPATVDVPSRFNQAGTAFVVLPKQCGGRIHQVVVLEADSSRPEVDVTCAPSEELGPTQPLDEMK